MEPAPGQPGLESGTPLSGCSRNSQFRPKPGKQSSLPPLDLGSGENADEKPGVGGRAQLGGTRKTPRQPAYETSRPCGTPPRAGVGWCSGGSVSPRPLGRPFSVPQGTKLSLGGSAPWGTPRKSRMNPEGEEEEEECEPEKGGRLFAGRLLDSRSLDGLSGACGGGAAPLGGPEQGAGGGRRATISSALELEGTVSRHGDLTHFVANNLQLKIRLSGNPQPQTPLSARPAPVPVSSIPPIDPEVLRDLERLSRDLGARVERLLRGLGGAVQELTALSVGCIQTYRDAVDSLGEAVDMSIKGMYTLLARCEELERALQPVQGLARQVRDIRRTLEVLEALCK
ncbi:BLOC-1-related complex subunit 6 [Antechinus flavipes]|uniref:BLOC-1-related complex subunit 6 n=1 Tax=Antechinus flavipes TaxID=38775 RepID=UPI002235DF5F|nr:BLOC-1-related complex subunit 6 [Antechinus flavipes]